ncbi:MAG: tetratricopeptide repeat protein [Candidatus Sericytochromatia bacterium]|nr:tetratricopeptide repeat protein [Candidatus Sericytochromatia bacterium]
MSVTTPLSLAEEHSLIRQSGGWARLDDWQLLLVSGPDAASYLQTQLTSDVLALKPGQAQRSALTDRKGHLQAEFWLYRTADQVLILVEACQSERLFAHLEGFHFVEDLSLKFETDLQLFLLVGPASRHLLALWQTELRAPLAQVQSLSQGGWLLQAALTGDLGYVLALPANLAENLQNRLIDASEAHKLIPIHPPLWDSLTLEAGIPRFGTELNTNTLLPETGLEHVAVSYDKGCYLGQEVIARIKTYGVIPRALIGLVLNDTSDTAEGRSLPAPGSEIFFQGKKVGMITRVGYAPGLQKNVALVYLSKQWRIPGQELAWESEGVSFQGVVRSLPFVPLLSASDWARNKLEMALEIFAGTQESLALPLLEEALLLDPNLIDAYESYGVILSRLGRHSEAISVMEQLLQVAPDAPMAHTNLSRFHMLLGDRDKAEMHMAEATRINMDKQIKSQAALQAEAQAQAQQTAARAEMMAMFREVLETEDPDDLVANYGLGKSLVDQGAFAEALAYLTKATQIDPLYSVAWLQLGKAYESLARIEEARATYRQGAVAASQKGDLMPLKEMEQRLSALPTA